MKKICLSFLKLIVLLGTMFACTNQEPTPQTVNELNVALPKEAAIQLQHLQNNTPNSRLEIDPCPVPSRPCIFAPFSIYPAKGVFSVTGETNYHCNLINPQPHQLGTGGYIYIHIDRLEPDGYYKLMLSTLFYTSNVISWSKTLPIGNYRAYLYIWDGYCGIWRRVNEEYFYIK